MVDNSNPNPESTPQPLPANPAQIPPSPVTPQVIQQQSMAQPPQSIDEPQDQPLPMERSEPVLAWSMHEGVRREKSFVWFVWFVLICVGLTGAVYLITRDLVAVIVAALVAGIALAGAARPSQEMHYEIVATGVRVGQRLFPFVDYKAFSMLENAAGVTIVLSPLRRMVLPLQMECPHELIDQITEVIGDALPYEQRSVDAVDRFARHIRF